MVKFLFQGLLLALCCCSVNSYSQLPYVENDPHTHFLLDRLHTKGVIHFPHQSLKTVNLSDIINLDTFAEPLWNVDQRDWDDLLRSIPEKHHLDKTLIRDTLQKRKGFLGLFYKDPYSMLTVDEPNFFLKMDPLIHFTVGDDLSQDGSVFQNTRGIQLRGTIDKKVYFFTRILENQQGFLRYVEDEISRINAIPGQGFFKPYQSGVIDNLSGWDYLNAQGYAGFKVSRSIDLRLGHGRHFIGNGIRSMLLSDYAHNYFYIQLNTKVWKFHYQNTFAELGAQSARDAPGNTLLPKKYMANHFLNLEVSKRLSIGLFESVIFGRSGQFEFQYLNPVILYRSVEQFVDSPDNVLLGLNAQWIVHPGWQLYGQLMIDELRTSEAFSGNGWWGNKIGYQLGLKAYDPFKINGLLIQIEHNTARPYTYAHRSDEIGERPVASYSHVNQSLAHPYGANFRETIVKMDYHPIENLFLSGTLLFSKFGSSPTSNLGRDILVDYQSRPFDFGHFTGQGDLHDIFAFHFQGSWQFFPNYFADIHLIVRRESLAENNILRSNYFGIGMRANLFDRHTLL